MLCENIKKISLLDRSDSMAAISLVVVRNRRYICQKQLLVEKKGRVRNYKMTSQKPYFFFCLLSFVISENIFPLILKFSKYKNYSCLKFVASIIFSNISLRLEVLQLFKLWEL